VIAQGCDQSDNSTLTNLPVCKHSAKVKIMKTTPPYRKTGPAYETKEGKKKATSKIDKTEDD
jgi:hypothetical protein